MFRMTIWCVMGAVSLAAGASDGGDAEVPREGERDVAFVADYDGTEQRYVVVAPPDDGADGPPRVALFYLHGHGSDRWQLVRQDRDECRSVLDVGRERNALCISPDYRATTSWMGPAAEADVVQIIAQLKRDYGVERIILSGGSMGGTAALSFAAMHPELVDAVASMNGTANLLEYENFQDAIMESFGGTKAAIPEEYKRRSAEYWPERLTMPIGATVSGQDESVPPQSVLRLAGVLRALDRDILIIHREELGHFTEYADARRILEFAFDRVAANE